MKIRIMLVLIIAVAFIVPSNAQKPAKKITISGIVSDADQKPIPGAKIQIDYLNTGKITNYKGYYKVKVSPDAKLIKIVTAMNGVSELVPIDGRTTINFTLKSSDSSLNSNKSGDKNEQSVNIGYGTVKKKNLTTTVPGTNDRSERFAKYTNIYDLIAGELPGVRVNGKNISIIGQGVITATSGSEPLYVVDGMTVSSIDFISPNTVKKVELLKGPSASIYGAQGANGVILITLKGTEKNK
jgi:TonB-dependent SusC/RagA subfamily outer membrane receptor